VTVPVAAAPTAPARPWWRPPGAVALGVAAAAVADVAFDPAHRNVPLCPFHAATGWYCPLCGGLRAVNAALRGHLAAAWRDNPLLWIAAPLLLGLWADWLVRARSGRAGRRRTRATTIAVVAVAVTFTVVRNLPGFAALRPA
jgi:hypothetical protein